MQVSVLLCVLRKHSPTYHLWQYQCYWYAYTVCEALKRIFPGYRETTLSEGRSRFCGQEIRKAESVEAVCELYRAEWARFENAAEEKRRAKEEEVHRVSVLFGDWLGCYLFVFTVEDGRTGSTSTRG